MINKLRSKKQGGFTLIELLVVIAIIGVLAAIAIPQFAAYRRRAYTAAIKSDLRNAANAQEAYFVDQNTYTNNVVDLTSRGYTQGQEIGMFATQGVNTFILTATHSRCGTDIWTFTAGNILDPPTPCL